MKILPQQYQQPLDLEKFILPDTPSEQEESLPLDVLFVGGGPAGLVGAIHLARQAKKHNLDIEIGVLEKASEIGGHTLSGAVINPLALQTLFPEKKTTDFPLQNKVSKEKVYFLTKNKAYSIPVPPTMKNHGLYTASLCQVVRWLGQEAEQLGVHLLTGFAAQSLLMNSSQKITGVKTLESGLNRDGTKGTQYNPSAVIKASATVLSEGTRGPLTAAYLKKMNISSLYQQTYALGIKEVWEVPKKLEHVIHTLSWPLDSTDFGGSWVYPIGENKVSIGLVIGLDYKKTSVNPHDKLQQLKQHPLFQNVLNEGKILEYGAKTIPEGGWNAIPSQISGDGVLLTGDTIGLVNVPALKGIHYAMFSGMYAADTLIQAFQKKDFSKKSLKLYDQKIHASFIKKDLYKVRNMRQIFKEGLIKGGLKAFLMTLTSGRFPSSLSYNPKEDALEEKICSDEPSFSSTTKLNKVDAVYLAGNKTRDDIPNHLVPSQNVDEKVGKFYEKLCPAGVYEWRDGKLQINAPNCIDCKATDVLGPRWTVREGGSGPHYQWM